MLLLSWSEIFTKVRVEAVVKMNCTFHLEMMFYHLIQKATMAAVMMKVTPTAMMFFDNMNTYMAHSEIV